VATQELVKAGAGRIEFDLQQQGRELGIVAERFAADQGFATELKALSATLALSPPRQSSGANSAAAGRARGQAPGADRGSQAEKHNLSAVTVVDEAGSSS